jgi:hypothetical protein
MVASSQFFGNRRPSVDIHHIRYQLAQWLFGRRQILLAVPSPSLWWCRGLCLLDTTNNVWLLMDACHSRGLLALRANRSSSSRSFQCRGLSLFFACLGLTRSQSGKRRKKGNQRLLCRVHATCISCIKRWLHTRKLFMFNTILKN